jgi:hypothetical protein
MSYNIYLYPQEVRTASLAGVDFEEIDGPAISPDIIERFKERLLRFGYALESTNPGSTEYIHPNKKWSIQVSIHKTMIAFSIPYWKDAKNAIFEALMTASELADGVGLCMYDPQADEWNSQEST